jgi:hypothetical protein
MLSRLNLHKLLINSNVKVNNCLWQKQIYDSYHKIEYFNNY